MSGRRIIALAGLSGAGKTTLIRKMSEKAEFLHLSASELIKEGFEGQGARRTSEDLRCGDIPDNQMQFVDAFKARAATTVGPIVLDCHTVIDTPAGLQRIPAETFDAIGITHLLFLTADPETLLVRRKRDSSRARPESTAAELAEQQMIAFEVAKGIAETLGIPFTEIGREPERALASFLKAHPWPAPRQLPQLT